jgi:signal peptidase I
MSTILIYLLLFLGCRLATALFLWIWAKWARIPGITFLRSLLAVFVMDLICLAVTTVCTLLLRDNPGLFWAIGTIVASVLSLWSLKALFRTTIRQAFQSWVISLAGVAGALALVFLVIKPYVLEAFITDNHTMAPTLLGLHQQATCPHCGQTATVVFPEFFLPHEADRWGICQSCQQAGRLSQVSSLVHAPDRFIVNKLLAPHRWDLIVFRSVQDQNIRYVKRLIGFPGEEVYIHEGKIWINGAKKEPPPEIANLTFVPKPEGSIDEGVPPETPSRLGSDQYFVLSDFSRQSADSRTWGPLPGKNIEGIVTIIYWPLSRSRVYR